jgi:Late competence development protein ComFB
MKNKITLTHKNVMEILVDEEINRQIKKYPPNLTMYINKVEVATYALNRLPPLYTSCQEGMKKQKERGEREFKDQISTSVRQAFAAVQRDLLRSSTPLISENDSELHTAKVALQELAEILPQNDRSWDRIVQLIKPLLVKITNREMTEEEIAELSYQLRYGWQDTRYAR